MKAVSFLSELKKSLSHRFYFIEDLNMAVEKGSVEEKIIKNPRLKRILLSLPLKTLKTMKNLKWLDLTDDEVQSIFIRGRTPILIKKFRKLLKEVPRGGSRELVKEAKATVLKLAADTAKLDLQFGRISVHDYAETIDALRFHLKGYIYTVQVEHMKDGIVHLRS